MLGISKSSAKSDLDCTKSSSKRVATSTQYSMNSETKLMTDTSRQDRLS